MKLQNFKTNVTNVSHHYPKGLQTTKTQEDDRLSRQNINSSKGYQYSRREMSKQGDDQQTIRMPQLSSYPHSNNQNKELTISSGPVIIPSEIILSPEVSNKDLTYQEKTDGAHNIPSQYLIRPSVFNLPNKPLNQKSYKLNFIQARLEGKRIDHLSLSSQGFNIRRHGEHALSDSDDAIQVMDLTQGNHQAFEASTKATTKAFNQDLAYPNTSIQGIAVARHGSAMNRNLSQKSRIQGNNYVRHQKAIQRKKKDQQFLYFQQQQRQNQQLIEKLNEDYAKQQSQVFMKSQTGAYGGEADSKFRTSMTEQNLTNISKRKSPTPQEQEPLAIASQKVNVHEITLPLQNQRRQHTSSKGRLR